MEFLHFNFDKKKGGFIKKDIFVLSLQSVGIVVEHLSGYQNLFNLFKKIIEFIKSVIKQN